VQVVLKGEGDDKLDVAREMLLEGLARLPRIHKVSVRVGRGRVDRRTAGSIGTCGGGARMLVPLCSMQLSGRVQHMQTLYDCHRRFPAAVIPFAAVQKRWWKSSYVCSVRVTLSSRSCVWLAASL
jgi:hypothetical protein